MLVPLVLLFDGSNQTSQAALHRAQIGDFIDLDLGIQIVADLQNAAGLIGGQRIQTAAEGHQVHQVHILLAGDVSRRRE